MSIVKFLMDNRDKHKPSKSQLDQAEFENMIDRIFSYGKDPWADSQGEQPKLEGDDN